MIRIAWPKPQHNHYNNLHEEKENLPWSEWHRRYQAPWHSYHYNAEDRAFYAIIRTRNKANGDLPWLELRPRYQAQHDNPYDKADDQEQLPWSGLHDLYQTLYYKDDNNTVSKGRFTLMRIASPIPSSTPVWAGATWFVHKYTAGNKSSGVRAIIPLKRVTSCWVLASLLESFPIASSVAAR